MAHIGLQSRSSGGAAHSSRRPTRTASVSPWRRSLCSATCAYAWHACAWHVCVMCAWTCVVCVARWYVSRVHRRGAWCVHGAWCMRCTVISSGRRPPSWVALHSTWCRVSSSPCSSRKYTRRLAERARGATQTVPTTSASSDIDVDFGRKLWGAVLGPALRF